MRPNSDLLAELNKDVDMLEQTKPLSIWTKRDLTVYPSENAILGVGEHRQIPVLLHPLMVLDARVSNLVSESLSLKAA